MLGAVAGAAHLCHPQAFLPISLLLCLLPLPLPVLANRLIFVGPCGVVLIKVNLSFWLAEQRQRLTC